MLTLYHKVTILIITLRTNAVDILIPSSVKNPAIDPSVTPIPPGMKVIAPKIVDVVKMDNTFK